MCAGLCYKKKKKKKKNCFVRLVRLTVKNSIQKYICVQCRLLSVTNRMYYNVKMCCLSEYVVFQGGFCTGVVRIVRNVAVYFCIYLDKRLNLRCRLASSAPEAPQTLFITLSEL